jgi:hypothetical protein
MTDAQRTYREAIAALPPNLSGVSMPGFNPHARKPDWREMTVDEAREWLLKEMGLA